MEVSDFGMDVHFRMADPSPRPTDATRNLASKDSIIRSSSFVNLPTQQHGCPKITILVAYAVSADKIATNTRFDRKRECVSHATNTSSSYNVISPVGATDPTAVWKGI